MNFKIEFTKRYFLIICVIIVLCSGLIVYAYDSHDNPVVMGHTSNEIIYSRGIFEKVKITCDGGVIDGGTNFVCYDPRGTGFFENGLEFKILIGFFTDSKNAICLALGGRGYETATKVYNNDDSQERINFFPTYLSWKKTPASSSLEVLEDVTCHK